MTPYPFIVIQFAFTNVAHHPFSHLFMFLKVQSGRLVLPSIPLSHTSLIRAIICTHFTALLILQIVSLLALLIILNPIVRIGQGNFEPRHFA